MKSVPPTIGGTHFVAKMLVAYIKSKIKTILFHFRFYVIKQIIVEEIDDRDPQAVAQL